MITLAITRILESFTIYLSVSVEIGCRVGDANRNVPMELRGQALSSKSQLEWGWTINLALP